MPVNDQGLPGKSRAVTYPLWWVGLTLRVKGNNISRIWVAVVAFALDMVCSKVLTGEKFLSMATARIIVSSE